VRDAAFSVAWLCQEPDVETSGVTTGECASLCSLVESLVAALEQFSGVGEALAGA